MTHYNFDKKDDLKEDTEFASENRVKWRQVALIEENISS